VVAKCNLPGLKRPERVYVGITWLINLGGGGQKRPWVCLYYASRKTQVLKFFLSLQHPNSRFENVPIFYFSIVARVAQSVYGLDGPGSNPGGDEIFRPSGGALGPTQPPVQ